MPYHLYISSDGGATYERQTRIETSRGPMWAVWEARSSANWWGQRIAQGKPRLVLACTAPDCALCRRVK